MPFQIQMMVIHLEMRTQKPVTMMIKVWILIKYQPKSTILTTLVDERRRHSGWSDIPTTLPSTGARSRVRSSSMLSSPSGNCQIKNPSRIVESYINLGSVCLWVCHVLVTMVTHPYISAKNKDIETTLSSKSHDQLNQHDHNHDIQHYDHDYYLLLLDIRVSIDRQVS